VLVRAAWVFAIGGVLELLGTSVAVILGVYAALFVLALPLLRWPPRRLLLAAGAVVLAGPPLTVAVGRYATGRGEEGSALASLLFTGSYPAAVWLAFVLVGLALGRADLAAARTRAGLVAAGAAARRSGTSGGGWSTRELTPGEPAEGIEAGFGASGGWDPAWFAGAEPHSSTPFEAVGSGGVAVAVIGVCLVLADLLPRLTSPLAAVGALALSVYTAHIVAISVVDAEGRYRLGHVGALHGHRPAAGHRVAAEDRAAVRWRRCSPGARGGPPVPDPAAGTGARPPPVGSSGAPGRRCRAPGRGGQP
jgi:hypothetical protein